jgi:hypothetical protein
MNLGGSLDEGGAGSGGLGEVARDEGWGIAEVQREEGWTTVKGSGQPKGIRSVEEFKGWEKIRIQVDSGAIDTVVPPGVARESQLKETKASKKGVGYVAANGA